MVEKLKGRWTWSFPSVGKSNVDVGGKSPPLPPPCPLGVAFSLTFDWCCHYLPGSDPNFGPLTKIKNSFLNEKFAFVEKHMITFTLYVHVCKPWPANKNIKSTISWNISIGVTHNFSWVLDIWSNFCERDAHLYLALDMVEKKSQTNKKGRK